MRPPPRVHTLHVSPASYKRIRRLVHLYQYAHVETDTHTLVGLTTSVDVDTFFGAGSDASVISAIKTIAHDVRNADTVLIRWYALNIALCERNEQDKRARGRTAFRAPLGRGSASYLHLHPWISTTDPFAAAPVVVLPSSSGQMYLRTKTERFVATMTLKPNKLRVLMQPVAELSRSFNQRPDRPLAESPGCTLVHARRQGHGPRACRGDSQNQGCRGRLA